MAGQTTRQIKRQIKGVKNVKQITGAMEMVSAAKLKRVEQKVDAIRPYWDRLRGILSRLLKAIEDPESPLLQPRDEVKRVGFIVLGGDKGLCGSYNSDLFKKAHGVMDDLPEDVEPVVVAIGKKTVGEFRKTGPEPIETMTDLPTEPSFSEARTIANLAEKRFRSGELDEVHIVYTKFQNALTNWPTKFQFLPARPDASVEEESEKSNQEREEASPEDEHLDLIFEPEPEQFLDQVLPRYVDVLFYSTLLEALCSEHGSRMVAMRNATDNAEDMIEDLEHTYNQARQESITRELLEIVGAVEAL